VVATTIYQRFLPEDKLKQTLHSFDGLHPLGWTGTACDLANTITFLLSPTYQLGHRRHLGRRRRCHGRTQLTTRGRPCVEGIWVGARAIPAYGGPHIQSVMILEDPHDSGLGRRDTS